jgi:pimeloyl-ACP methyl ester carboxylesterase
MASLLEKGFNAAVLIVLCAFVVSMLITVDFLSNMVVNPNCCADDLPSRKLNKAWSKFGSLADAGVQDAEQVQFPGQDGSTLEGWLVPGKGKRSSNGEKLIVLVHDSGQDMKQVYELALQIQKRLGWVSLVFNTRETQVSAFGRVATADVNAAVSYVRAKSHALTRRVEKVGVMGISVGAASGLMAAVKDTSVDAFVAVSMPSTAHQYWQSLLQTAIGELKASIQVRQEKKIPVGWQARFTSQVADWAYVPVSVRMEESEEQANFMAKMAELSKGWFIDLIAHLTVIRGAGFRAWLQGIADPHKSIHRLAPRSFLLAHGEDDRITPTWLVQNIYNRAGHCQPKLARIQPKAGHILDLRKDDEFWDRLRSLMG